MKIEMKKFFLFLMFAFLSVQINYGQVGDGPPIPPIDCEACDELQADGLVQEAENCRVANGCTTFSINSSILFLFASAISLGSYFFYKNHKKNLHLK